jgi:hypothetical protein
MHVPRPAPAAVPLAHRRRAAGARSRLALQPGRPAPAQRGGRPAGSSNGTPAGPAGPGTRSCCTNCTSAPSRPKARSRPRRAPAGTGRPGHHRHRADAGGRLPGPLRLGLRRRAAVRAAPAYGTPDDLKAFVQQAHRLGLMVFLDVVYNHFGPDGNYLRRYAPSSSRRRAAAPGARPSTSTARAAAGCASSSSTTPSTGPGVPLRRPAAGCGACHQRRQPARTCWRSCRARARGDGRPPRAPGAGEREQTTSTWPHAGRRAATTASGTTTSTTRCTWR